ncbi:hypothetical protein A2U01_0039551, partial [Trifolium medium]|nr:hypothetical protein [Trifolium medium]
MALPNQQTVDYPSLAPSLSSSAMVSQETTTHLDRDRVPLSSIETEMDMKMSKKKKKADEMDLETSSEKPKRRPAKKAVLVGLKLPPQMMKNMN